MTGTVGQAGFDEIVRQMGHRDLRWRVRTRRIVVVARLAAALRAIGRQALSALGTLAVTYGFSAAHVARATGRDVRR